ncbi:MAG: PIN domain-containing protein [Bryobacteraceae bacterium]
MRTIFADTFYWTALTSPDDTFYLKALEFSRLLVPDRIITSDDVLVEYLAFFAKAGPSVRAQAGRLVARLLQDPRVVVVPQSHELFLDALDLYRGRPDKSYSLTDCISMLIMRRQGITGILTHDRHFEQEGFRALFRDS